MHLTKYSQKKIDTFPMLISGMRRVPLDIEGYEKAGDERIWHGTGLPVYRYDLRFQESKRLYDTLTIRAANPVQAVKLIKARMPNVVGVYDP